jgi:hypothetical protein
VLGESELRQTDLSSTDRWDELALLLLPTTPRTGESHDSTTRRAKTCIEKEDKHTNRENKSKGARQGFNENNNTSDNI